MIIVSNSCFCLIPRESSSFLDQLKFRWRISSSFICLIKTKREGVIKCISAACSIYDLIDKNCNIFVLTHGQTRCESSKGRWNGRPFVSQVLPNSVDFLAPSGEIGFEMIGHKQCRGLEVPCQLGLAGERGLVVGRWICNPEVPGSNPSPCHRIDLSSVAPNSTPPRLVNSQLVSLPPVGILNLLCLICIIFVCYGHLNIFTWNLRDIDVYYYYYYY